MAPTAIHDFMIDRVHKPIRSLLTTIDKTPKLTLKDIRVALELLRDIQKYPEATKESTSDPNIHILIDTWEDILAHLKIDELRPVFRTMARFSTSKLSYDREYKNLFHLFLATLLARGWEFPKQFYPSSRVWRSILPSTEIRLNDIIRQGYDTLERQYRLIEEKFGDLSEVEEQKAKARDEMMQRIIIGIKKEVVLWRR